MGIVRCYINALLAICCPINGKLAELVQTQNPFHHKRLWPCQAWLRSPMFFCAISSRPRKTVGGWTAKFDTWMSWKSWASKKDFCCFANSSGDHYHYQHLSRKDAKAWHIVNYPTKRRPERSHLTGGLILLLDIFDFSLPKEVGTLVVKKRRWHGSSNIFQRRYAWCV